MFCNPRRSLSWGGLCTGEISVRGRSLSWSGLSLHHHPPPPSSAWGGLCLERSLPGEVSVLGRSLSWRGLCRGRSLSWSGLSLHHHPPPPRRGQASDPRSESKHTSFGSESPQLFPKGSEAPLGRRAERDRPSRRPSQGLSHPAALRAKGQRHLSGMEVGAGGMPGPGLADPSRRCYRNEGQWAEGTDSGEGDTQS